VRQDSPFVIGKLKVDPVARQMSSDQGDVSVEPKVFDLLLYLAAHRGRAVPQDELLEQVWGRTVASDAVVSQAIHKLRRLLKNGADLPDALVTLRGVGYRLDAQVNPFADQPVPSAPEIPSQWRWIALGLVVLAAGLIGWQRWYESRSEIPRIALLELENVTGDAELDWVSAGATALMSETLLRRGIDLVSSRDLDELRTRSGNGDAGIVDAARQIGVQRVLVPRLLAEAGGFRLELIDLTDRSSPTLELTGSGPAALSLAMASQVADQVEAPLRSPAGSLGLGNPFLDEAYARAYYHRQKGDYKDARELYDYILREAPDAHWARYHLSITLNYSGEVEAARQELEALLGESLQDPWLAAAVRSSMGNLAWYQGDLESAESYYVEARQRFAAHEMRGGVASALGNLGMIAFSRAEFERGREFVLQALDIYQRQGNQIQVARVLHNLGYSYFDQGLFEPALEALEQAYEIRVQLGLLDQGANTMTVIAEVAIDQGRLDEGERLLERALEVFMDVDNERGRGRALADLARVANRRGDYPRAKDLALESLALARSRNEVASANKAALILGRSLRALGDLHGADEYFVRVADDWAKLDNLPGQIVSLAERVRVALDAENAEVAADLLDQLQPLVNELGDSRYHDTLRVLELRLKLVNSAENEFESDLDALLEALDQTSFEHAELLIELAHAIHGFHPNHSTLDRLRSTARRWASRDFPSARLLYLAPGQADDCERARRAFEQLLGPDWSAAVTSSSHCIAAVSGTSITEQADARR